jgi:trk system potassium uptake protein TrkH
MGSHLNFKLIAKVLSINLFIITVSFLTCLIIAFIYHENFSPFIISAEMSFFLAVVFYFSSINFDKHKNIHKKDAYFTVTSSWILIGLIGAIPYVVSNSTASLVDAIFESISGFTTTGSSILTDIESLPKSLLFWRSLTHWIGGIGIIILVIIILPSLKIGGYHLFTSESSLQDKMKPRITQVGNRLLLIYVSLTLAEVFFLMMGDMNLYESVCHAFGTIATGGFSPKNTSIVDYSPYIQYVITIFMLLAGVNFVIHYYIFKGEFSKIRYNEEFRYYLRTIFVIGSIITLTLYIKMDKDFEESFRESFFQVVSTITCTGFASADYLDWPIFAWLLIFFAMFIGGSTGSTAGGIKIARHLIMSKNIKNIFKSYSAPRAILPVKLNNVNIGRSVNTSIKSFVMSYILIFIIGSIIIICLGVDAQTSMSSVATCMAGIGPGIGKVGPASNFFYLPQAVKMILAFLMIVGRLEIYTILILFTKSYWKH